MNPICVGAKRRRVYYYCIYQYIPAAVESEMKLRTIPNFQSMDSHIGAHEEP